MIRNVCIYCASSNAIGEHYFRAAEETGRLLAEKHLSLVYGGGNVGLMGAVARSVHRHGGTVYGVIPEALKAIEGVAYELADELVITGTMQERKAIMFTRADAFLVLPGGFGTLEELMEVLTLKQLRYHEKPIIILNLAGFYNPLIELFEHFRREGFNRHRYDELFLVAGTPEEAVSLIGRTGH